ncbi:MAG: helix-turn-helix domain-containing protein [Microcystis aeruginosa K13-06]|nr:helix-turn-helix domain-containing protein [Microcystis aeruginosa K13-06]
MEKAYSYRFYPTPTQESLLRRTLGCVRLGTCALIMYLLGERSSPLHCGQNPLL